MRLVKVVSGPACCMCLSHDVN